LAVVVAFTAASVAVVLMGHGCKPVFLNSSKWLNADWSTKELLVSAWTSDGSVDWTSISGTKYEPSF
jgi:hypothetical protein